MIVKVTPAQCRGGVQVPPSKSMAHRALICAGLAGLAGPAGPAGLAGGASRLDGIGDSQDMAATIGAMQLLGAQFTRQGSRCTVKGTGGVACSTQCDMVVNCRESGSTLRFMIPLFALSGARTTFTGQGRLMQRSQTVYEQLFRQRGLLFEQQDGKLTIQGPLRAGEYILDGNVSSQFITGLLFALPMLQGDSILRIRPPFQSRGYVSLTVQMLAAFGVNVHFSDENTLVIPGKQAYAACDHRVEGDYSQAAFYAVLAAIQGKLTLQGLRRDSLQGDRVILDILADCGAGIAQHVDGVDVTGAPLVGTQIDVSDCPDLAPILSVMGMYASGTTHLVNAARLRDKESDRIAVMEQELRKLGAQVHTTHDAMTIVGCGNRPCFGPTSVLGHNDHRVVMSLAIAATLGSAPVIIEGAQAVTKSYPNFFEHLALIGGRIEVMDE